MPEEDALIRDCLSGKLDAFEILTRRHYRRVFQTVFMLLGNREDAEDVTQEVFIRAFKGIRSFRGDAAFSTWLHRIAVNAAATFAARRQARAEIHAPLEDVDCEHSAHCSSEVAALAAERRREVLEAIRGLPDHYRIVLAMRHLHEMSYDQIASALGIPIGTVRSRLSKAREVLLSILAAAQPDRRKEAMSR